MQIAAIWIIHRIRYPTPALGLDTKGNPLIAPRYPTPALVSDTKANLLIARRSQVSDPSARVGYQRKTANSKEIPGS